MSSKEVVASKFRADGNKIYLTAGSEIVEIAKKGFLINIYRNNELLITVNDKYNYC